MLLLRTLAGSRLIVSPKEIGWMTLAEMAKADGAGVDE